MTWPHQGQAVTQQACYRRMLTCHSGLADMAGQQEGKVGVHRCLLPAFTVPSPTKPAQFSLRWRVDRMDSQPLVRVWPDQSFELKQGIARPPLSYYLATNIN